MSETKKDIDGEAAHAVDRYFNYMCQRCKQPFQLRGKFENHVLKNNCHFRKSLTSKYECPFEGCGRAFVSPSNLNKHIR